MKEKDSQTSSLTPGIYLVATPIGNLGDITFRAVELLKTADVIACEDTRISSRLMQHYGIATPLTPYHEHNAEKKRPELLQRARSEIVALISDAGTPLISDPGYKLVAEAAEESIHVEALPGASSALVALCVSGLPSHRFLFEGFLPPKDGHARRVLETLKSIPTTLIFFESARRLPGALERMAEILGERDVAVARELTKLHEEVRRGSLKTLAEHYQQEGPPRGEVVIVVGPPPEQAEGLSEDKIRALLEKAMQTGSMKTAVEDISRIYNVSRRRVYQLALAMKESK